MIEITPDLWIEDSEIEEAFIQATGPGGQNINKVASAVQLRFNLAASSSLPDEVKQRLINLAGKRITTAGILVIEAKRSRSQRQNRQEALTRLVDLIRQAARKPQRRRKTKPPQAAIEKRLQRKSHRSRTKRLRQRPSLED